LWVVAASAMRGEHFGVLRGDAALLRGVPAEVKEQRRIVLLGFLLSETDLGFEVRPSTRPCEPPKSAPPGSRRTDGRAAISIRTAVARGRCRRGVTFWGSGAPASASEVGSRSIMLAGSLVTPGFTRPGIHAIPGTRIPPFPGAAFAIAQQPGAAALVAHGEPRTIVAGEKDERVFRDTVPPPQGREHFAHAPVKFLHGVTVDARAAFAFERG
jgi:hypothetical protein